MKAVAYMKPGVELVDIEEPVIHGGDDVKIKMAYCGICGSDIHIVHGAFDPIIPQLPFPIGHESTGVIVELGPKATAKGLKVGDKVAYYYNLYCGKCHFCKNGQEHLCTGVTFNMSSMCEYIVVSEAQVWKLPEDVSLLKGALSEPISFCLHTVDMGNIKPGDTAVVSGGGAIGLMTMLLCKRAGASKITVIEPIAEKREMALKLGASYVIDPMTEDVCAKIMEITSGRGYDAVFECSGAKPTIQACLTYASAGATIVYAAMYGDGCVNVNLYDLFNREIKITAPHQSPYTWQRTMSLISELDLDLFTQCVYPKEDFAKAFEAQRESKNAKVIIKINADL
ncbi:MAG: alcohol dehydrogenase catalytic domain-containing protein [Oscillospiraceae bacterium]